MDEVQMRPLPSNCGNCESRSVRKHCSSHSCRWTRCANCGALTCYLRTTDFSMPARYRWRRKSIGGDPARRADRKDC